MEQILAFLEPLLMSLSGKYGVLVTILTYCGALRLFFKPLMSMAQSYVDFTVNPNDNEKLAKLMSSKPYQYLAYTLDWFGSLKLPKVG